MASLITGHADLIHDIAYDHYGRLLATCSSDQHIRVFSRKSSADPWTFLSATHAHERNILSLTFAPPQFGTLLASCSEDQSVRIFFSSDNGRAFDRVATLSDSPGAVHKIAFAKFGGHGLKLATIGTDSVVRLYHAADPSDLRQWHLAVESEVESGSKRKAQDMQASFSVAWCPAGVVTLPPSSAYNKPSSSSSSNNTFANSGVGDLPSRISALEISERSVEQFVVSAMTRVVVFRKRYYNSQTGSAGPYDFEECEELPGHEDLVRDVAWASNAAAGGRYELIATACKDGYVRIFKLTPRLSYAAGDTGEMFPTGEIEYDVVLAASFDDHHGEVWKVSWNVSGTVLSSSGDDGQARFWRANYRGEWIGIGSLSAEQGHVADNAGDEGDEER
ncbi:WD40-repeat-containing domain protein [Myxozyma melibiosi]|uniref:WD40-repeat-containing domain protein n=1 Tax=Myxozyma melibiosi TaxID=54550 RepID=A0ABR1F9Q0_9ASCO